MSRRELRAMVSVAMAAARDPDQRLFQPLGHFQGAEDDGRRAVRDRRAVQDAQRIGHQDGFRTASTQILNGILGQRVLRPVVVVLDRDHGQLLAGRPVFVHVGARPSWHRGRER